MADLGIINIVNEVTMLKKKLLGEKLKESFASVIPIAVIVSSR